MWALRSAAQDVDPRPTAPIKYTAEVFIYVDLVLVVLLNVVVVDIATGAAVLDDVVIEVVEEPTSLSECSSSRTKLTFSSKS